MKRLFSLFLSFTMLMSSPSSNAWSLSSLRELLPSSTRNSINWNSDLAVVLRDQGFSDQAIAFALRASHDTLDPNAASQIAESLLLSSQASVRQLAMASQNAEQLTRLIKRRKIIDGTVVGAIAAAFLITEGLYAYSKTRDNFATAEDAMATNLARVAVVSGATTIAADQFMRRGVGNKLAGLLFAAMAAYSVAAGTSQIAIEQMNYATAQEIEKARERLETLLGKEKELVRERREQRQQLIAEKDALLVDRANIFSTKIPQGLIERRDQLQKELDRHQLQLEAYSINVKKGSPQLKYAEELKAQGFTHVGIYMDGDASNDVLYLDDLLPKTEAEIARVSGELQPLKEEIQKYALKGTEDSLSASDRALLTSIDASLQSLSTQIESLTKDNAAVLALRESYSKSTEYLAYLETQNIGPDENLFDRLEQFTGTEDGLNAVVSGSIFGIMSVLGGIILHRAIHIYTNRGAIPRNSPGSTRIDGIDIRNLTNRDYALRMELELRSYNRALSKPGGIESFVAQAAESEVKNFSHALNVAQRTGHITPDQFQRASSVMTSAINELPEKLTKQASFIDNLFEFVTLKNRPDILNHPTVQRARHVGAAAKSARMTGNLPVVGGVMALTVMGLTEMMFTSQAKAAVVLANQGFISQEALESYKNDVQTPARAVLLGDIAVSLADPTGLTIPFTLVAEGLAASFANDWADVQAPHLRQALLKTLSPSLMGGESISAEFVSGLKRNLPRATEGQDEVLHRVILARSAMEAFARTHPRPHVSQMAPAGVMAQDHKRLMLWKAQLAAYRDTFLDEVTQLVSERAHLPIYLNLYPVDDRLALVQRLAASDKKLIKEPGPFADVAAYIDNRNNRVLPQFLGENPAARLWANPDLINSYILHRMGVEL